MLRIGPTKPGQSRYVELARTQALTVARALMVAAEVTGEAYSPGVKILCPTEE